MNYINVILNITVRGCRSLLAWSIKQKPFKNPESWLNFKFQRYFNRIQNRTGLQKTFTLKLVLKCLILKTQDSFNVRSKS